MTRKQINLKLSTYAELDKFRGTHTFDKAIKELLRENGKSRKLELEVEKLNQQLEDYKQQLAKKPAGDAGEPSITDPTEITCFSRYQHNGILLCANLHPPKSLEIKSLKRCLHCRKRLSTKIAERQGLIVKTKNFVTCGAEEHTDQKKGVMLYCHRGSKYGGQWVTPKDCQKAKCIDFKEVKTPL